MKCELCENDNAEHSQWVWRVGPRIYRELNLCVECNSELENQEKHFKETFKDKKVDVVFLTLHGKSVFKDAGKP